MGIAHRQLGREDEPLDAGGVKVGLVLVDQWFARIEDPLFVGRVFHGPSPRIEIGVSFAQQHIWTCHAHQLRHLRVRGHEAALGVLHIDGHRQVIDQRA